MNKKPLIAITMGDPAGIGPEIIAKVFDTGEVFSHCRPVIVGNAGVMKKIVEDLRLSVSMRTIGTIAEADPASGKADVLHLANVDLAKHLWGRPNAASGKAVVEYVKLAAELAMSRKVDAIVTAPINKEMMNAAGFDYSGHTELLASLTNSTNYGMMFVGGGLKLILVTIHHAITDLPRLITRDRVLRTIRLAHAAMQGFGIEKPRVGVAAFNPHASEGGLFGHEELDEILPAVLAARGEGIDASDPLPADTLFFKARNNYFDIVVAMYHDQGLAPLKMLAFGNAVNVTVGLPIIRTSVDHGTAYDIAGKGCADPSSLLEAVKLAAQISKHQKGAGEERA
ncbi:MAG: 4-hydroxythreonine-4-phosphate dehydrogenase PdxA [Nitrospirae bacterium]|nr:4-hydroxythreonine-4-phosphate dehydrogenase PdxA [Nitrospirota bacterium]NTW66474.1 4-hydroxythreonine-4-phosphate dehydrogenase PdxA [Nitrospirota bacterium]